MAEVTLPVVRHAFMMLFLAVVGCGGTTKRDTDTEPEPVPSGSRLRARWEVAGTARRLIGWHDAALGLDCGFEHYQHGRKHLCIPEVGRARKRFSDANCSQPLVTVEPESGTQLPEYFMTAPVDPCSEEPEFYVAGSRLPSNGL